MKIVSLFLFISMVFTTAAYAERIQLKSGRIFEAEILLETEDFIEIKFYGTPIRFYRHEIKAIGGSVPQVEQGGLTRALYKVYRDSQEALAREDKEVYKATLSRKRAYRLEQESESFFESLKLLKRFGMDPRAPKVPEYVVEYDREAVLLLSDPLVESAGVFSLDNKLRDVPVLRITYLRENYGWKIHNEQRLLKPSWMSYDLLELAQQSTRLDIPEQWGSKFSDNTDENQFKYSDVSALEFSDDKEYLYIRITFDEVWPKEYLNFNIYFNMDQSDLTWFTSHDNIAEQISGWQYRLEVGPSVDQQKEYPLAYSVFPNDTEESKAEVFFEQSRGWILDQGASLVLKVPLVLLELDRNKNFKFAIVDA